MTSRADALKVIEEIKKTSYKLNPWEQGFLDNIADHRQILPLSEKQSKCLIKIYEKATDIKKEKF